MKYSCVVISVSDVKAARKFYEDLFGLEIYQDYGLCIAFSCGLSLQQEFDWLTGLPKEKILKESNNMELCFEEENFNVFLEKLKGYGVKYAGDVVEHSWGQRTIRFYDLDGHMIEVGESMKMVINRYLTAGHTMEEISKIIDASTRDLEKLLNA